MCYLSRIFTSNWSCKNRRICTASSGVSTKRAMLSLSRNLPRVIICRSYQRDNNSPLNQSGVLRRRLWTIVRGIFLATGGLVWLVAFFAYLSLEKVSVDLQEDANRSGLNALEKKLMNHFYEEKDEAGILKKDDALDHVWRKLNQEDRIKEIFGQPVYICGYNYSNKIEELLDQTVDSKTLLSKGMEFGQEKGKEISEIEKGNESEVDKNKIWEAGCYIEGSKKLGLLKVKFEEHKHDWVPVALHLETLEKSGQVISDVSASLPNGIKNFTRLSN